MTSTRKPLDYEGVRELGKRLPGVEDSKSYGTPALKVNGKTLVRLKEDGETLVLRIPIITRDILMNAQPETFHITDHYRDYPAVLVTIAKANRAQLSELIEDAWRELAPRKIITTFDAR